MKECRFYMRMDGEGEYAPNTVRCELCPHCCVIMEGKHGKCGSRWNFNGMLYSVVYGKPCALADDPIEKKPLIEFHPGTRCLSLPVQVATSAVSTVRTMTSRRYFRLLQISMSCLHLIL